jgi:hypothetical protein
MRYSLTRHKPKELLAADTKLWWIFILLLLALFFVIKLLISFHVAGVEKRVDAHMQQRENYQAEQAAIEEQIEFIQAQVALAVRVNGRNTVIKDSLINLFDLTPEQIYLDRMEVGEKSLHLQGHTPSREVFNFMLRPPLESIFERTEVSFYPAGGGWFAFDVRCSSSEALIYATP